MEFQKFISQGKILKIASKKNNKSYKKQSAKKEVRKEQLNWEFPKEGFYGEKFGTGLKKRTGHSQECKSKKGTLRQDKNEIGLKKLPRKLLLKNTRTRWGLITAKRRVASSQ